MGLELWSHKAGAAGGWGGRRLGVLSVMGIFRQLGFQVWLSPLFLPGADRLTNLIDSLFDLNCQKA